MINSPEFLTPDHRSLTPPHHKDNIEGLGSRIQRHVKELAHGNIDLGAVVRGTNQVYDKLTLMREGEGNLTLRAVNPNYEEVEGLDFSLYSFVVPVGPSKPAYSPEFTTYRDVQIRVLDFPTDSHLEIILTPAGQPCVHTNSTNILGRLPKAIAAITGPTYLRGDNLPNNGFYSQATGDIRPFRETNPPGERRGAFGLSNDGKLILMSDEQKWAVVNQDFTGFKYLVGTSNYILGTDSDQSYPDLAQSSKNCLSYLLQSEQLDGSARYTFVRNERMMSRDRLRRVMQHHSTAAGRRMIIAMELEFGNASCVVKSGNGKTEFGTGFNDRRDHYIFTRN